MNITDSGNTTDPTNISCNQVIKKIREAWLNVCMAADEDPRARKCLIIYAICVLLTVFFRIRIYTAPSISALAYFLSDALLISTAAFTGYIAWQLNKTLSDTDKIDEARIAAEKANEAKSRFLANMSHEIRTPISAILGMNEMILRECDDDTIKGYAYNIEDASTNLLSLVNDILDFSKIESGKMEIVESEYETGALVNELKTMFRMKAEDKQIKLRFDIDGRIPKKLQGDPLRVKQICMNLISNAIKYTDSGEVVFIMRWEREKDGRASIIIIVRDTGRGIKEEDIPLLFEKFQRADLKNNSNIEGTGLGLAITRTLVESMGGNISVESEYGKGSRFTAVIMQGVKDPEPLGDYRNFMKLSRDEVRGNASYSAPDADILIVDDTRLNVEVLSGLLKNIKVQVESAYSGEACIKQAEKRHYDIILMDARMPRMDGVETLNELNRRHLIDNTKVIVITADAVTGAKERYMSEGFDGYLVKPVKPALLEQAIKDRLPAEKIMPPAVKRHMSSKLPGWLYDLEYINPEEGLKMCGDPETYTRSLECFSRYAMEYITEMQNALKARDIKNFTIRIHALKSSAKLIGASELSELARMLEEAGDQGDMSYIGSNVGKAFHMYARIANSLKPLYVGRQETAKGCVDMDDVPALYRHLKEYVEDFNDEAVGSMLAGLSHYSFPGNEQERFDKLVKAHDVVDWAEMLELLKGF